MTARRARGFTLLELIVVIGIFGIFAAMAYGGLDSVLRTRVRIEEGLTRTENYDRAYLRMRSDFENASFRNVRGGDGEALPPFAFDSYTRRIEFTRGGWQNLLNLPRSTLERVSYFLDDSQPTSPTGGQAAGRRFEDKRLVRRSWYVLDRAPQTQPVEVVVLEHVDELSFRFLDDSRNWQDAWASGANGAFGDNSTNASLPAPMAVEMKLKTRDWGELKFLFRLGAEASNQIPKLFATVAAPPAAAPGATGASGSPLKTAPPPPTTHDGDPDQ